MEIRGRERQIVDERIRKIKRLRDEGVDPYPQDFDKKDWCNELQGKYFELENGETSDAVVSCAGRLMLKRSMGRISFGTILDDGGRIQVLVQEGESGDDAIKGFRNLDVGDFVGVVGRPMRTKRGELSILCDDVRVLTKAVMPLPEKFHGIRDKEDRYRKRYLDLIMNDDVKDVFRTRSKIIYCLREFLIEEGFMEVETPLIQSVYGGASSKPFVTHINALDMDAYLSISPELYLKRLVVGGYEKVFTICKNFRNEGVDYSHNPEFTMMEYYVAYKNFEYHIDFIQRFFAKLKTDLELGDSIEYRGNTISLVTPFKRISFRDLLLEKLDIDIDIANDFEKLKVALDEKKIGVEVSGCYHYGSLLDEVYKRLIRPGIIQPIFLTHYPVEMIALAKKNKEDPSKINSVQLVIDGAEIMKGYDELNDPVDQRERLGWQDDLKGSGDDEAMPMDEDFIDSLMYGMPPTAGFGMGVDRLVMILTGMDSIRDVIFFPFMKPIGSDNTK